MKHLCSLLFLASPLASFADSPVVIHVRSVTYSTDLTTATLLLDEFDPTEGTHRLHAKFVELQKQGKAKLTDLQQIAGRPGDTAYLQSVRELIHPGHYARADIGPTKGSNLAETRPFPTAFETRSLGATFEIEPSFDEETQVVDLRIQPEWVELIDEVSWTKNSEQGAPGSDASFPLLHNKNQSTSLSLQLRKYHFVGTQVPLGEDKRPDRSRLEFVFVHADTEHPLAIPPKPNQDPAE